MPKSFDVAIIGGGIVGLATALALSKKQPGRSLLLIEAEPTFAAHQTGHNSLRPLLQARFEQSDQLRRRSRSDVSFLQRLRYPA